MYLDLRIRNSNRSTPIPRGCKAYVFHYLLGDVFKVIVSDDIQRAIVYFREWADDQGIDLSHGWRLLPYVDDFDVVLSDNLLPLK